MQPEMKPVQSTYRIGRVHRYEADVLEIERTGAGDFLVEAAAAELSVAFLHRAIADGVVARGGLPARPAADGRLCLRGHCRDSGSGFALLFVDPFLHCAIASRLSPTMR